jgi:polyisoprenoid-binding protein YceI
MRSYFSLFLFLLFYTACSEAPRGDEVIVRMTEQPLAAKGDAFVADTAASRIRFVGRGVGKSHAGIFKLSSGIISVAENKITGGSFVINIKSIELEEKGGVYDRKLYPHLMGEDFFEAERFNTATFDITGVEVYNTTSSQYVVDSANFMVSGNLTLKEVTHNISFPARIDLTDSSLKAASNFVMNRKLWNMNYGSEKSLGDKFINEKVNIQLQLEAKRN